MRKQIIIGSIEEKRLLNITELRAYTGLGRSSALKFGESSGAIKRFGKRVLYDKTIIDQAINQM